MVIDPTTHFFQGTTNAGGAQSTIHTNLNGVTISRNGSFTGLWRTQQCSDDLVSPKRDTFGPPLTGCSSVIHSLTGRDWWDPASYTFATQNDMNALTWQFEDQYSATAWNDGIEDPMVYIDSRFPLVYHAIFRLAFAGGDNVGHATSLDGATWTYTGAVLPIPTGATQPVATFTDGTTASLTCNRPQMVVKDGVPTHLTLAGVPTGLGTPADPTLGAATITHCTTYDWPCGATLVAPLTPYVRSEEDVSCPPLLQRPGAPRQLRNRERRSLLALHKATRGELWTNAWPGDLCSDPCDPAAGWHGVECDDEGYVQKLHLADQRLVGTIPPVLGYLRRVEYIDLSANKLTHEIPAKLGLIGDSLLHLDLSNNRLQSTIPAELAQLTSLRYLNLLNNPDLGGTIPSALSEKHSAIHIAFDGSTSRNLESLGEREGGYAMRSTEEARINYRRKA